MDLFYFKVYICIHIWSNSHSDVFLMSIELLQTNPHDALSPEYKCIS